MYRKSKFLTVFQNDPKGAARLLEDTLTAHDGSVERASAALDINWSSLHRYIRRYPEMKAALNRARKAVAKLAEEELRK